MKKRFLTRLLSICLLATGFKGGDSGNSAVNGNKDEIVTIRFMGYNAESVRKTYLEYLSEKQHHYNLGMKVFFIIKRHLKKML